MFCVFKLKNLFFLNSASNSKDLLLLKKSLTRLYSQKFLVEVELQKNILKDVTERLIIKDCVA